MENIFETIAAATSPKEIKLTALRAELATVTQRIDKIHGHTDYTDRVAASFHLGMVGGSGRNTASLNRKRERALDKTIDNAKICVQLYKQRNALTAQIADIENNGEEKRRLQKERLNAARVVYWNEIKVGDKIDIGGNYPAEVTKKNAKSLETGTGCKWTAAEIIGKEAAQLI